MCGIFQRSFQIKSRPTDVRRKDKLLRCQINPPGYRHSDSLKIHLRMGFDYLAQTARQFRYEPLRIRSRQHRFLRQEFHVQSSQSNRCVKRSNIDPDNSRPLPVEVQEGRLAAAWKMTNCPLRYPPLSDQLFSYG